ncbi:MAG: hypothetical protein ACFFD1_13075 [Candidatus Thorarchaeota archaeon]
MGVYQQMIIYAVYIISSQGSVLLSENFYSPDEIPNEDILGGLLIALQGAAGALQGENNNSEMKSIEIEGLSYHFRSFGLYRVVLVTDVPTRPESIIQTVGYRFMREFGEKIEHGKLESDLLRNFRKSIYEILGKEYFSDESKLIRPKKKFSTSEIFSLPNHLQKTALAMISLQEGTIEEIAKEIGSDEELALNNIMSLQKMGFIGNRNLEGKTHYFCSAPD